MSSIADFFGQTMLIERFAGVFVYALFLSLFTFLVYKSNSKKHVTLLLAIYLVILMIMAFFFIPEPSSDLYRWLDITKNWSSYSFSYFLNEIAFKSNVPIAYLFIYLCRRTQINGILPMMSAFIFYSCFFSCLRKSLNDFNLKYKHIAIMLFVFMSMGRFVEIIAGVRCLVAVAIFSRCVYSEVISSKRHFFIKTLFLQIIEIIACLMHPFILVLFIIKSILSIFRKGDRLFERLFRIALLASISILVFTFGSSYIFSAISKTESYLFNEHYGYAWEYFIAILMVLVIVYTIVVCVRSLKFGFSRVETRQKNVVFNFLLFSSIFLIIAIVFLFQYSIFHRMITYVSILSLPLIGFALKNRSNSSFERNIMLLSIVILFIACSRGDLCSYKFFEL